MVLAGAWVEWAPRVPFVWWSNPLGTAIYVGGQGGAAEGAQVNGGDLVFPPPEGTADSLRPRPVHRHGAGRSGKTGRNIQIPVSVR